MSAERFGPHGGETTVSYTPVAGETVDQPGHLADPRAVAGPAVVVVRGAQSGTTWRLLDRVVRAGRHPDCGISLDDVTVSRDHAELRKTDEGVLLVDLGSTNGVYLNGQITERALLKDGDQILIGKYYLVFVA